MTGKYVYIASPYTHGDVVANVRAVVLAANELVAVGFIPFLPHLSFFWHYLCPHEVEFWYQQDLAWLDKCDCLLRLPGDSPGADNEVRYARDQGIPVYFTIAECVSMEKVEL